MTENTPDKLAEDARQAAIARLERQEKADAARNQQNTQTLVEKLNYTSGARYGEWKPEHFKSVTQIGGSARYSVILADETVAVYTGLSLIAFVPEGQGKYPTSLENGQTTALVTNLERYGQVARHLPDLEQGHPGQTLREDSELAFGAFDKVEQVRKEAYNLEVKTRILNVLNLANRNRFAPWKVEHIASVDYSSGERFSRITLADGTAAVWNGAWLAVEIDGTTREFQTLPEYALLTAGEDRNDLTPGGAEFRAQARQALTEKQDREAAQSAAYFLENRDQLLTQLNSSVMIGKTVEHRKTLLENLWQEGHIAEVDKAYHPERLIGKLADGTAFSFQTVNGISFMKIFADNLPHPVEITSLAEYGGLVKKLGQPVAGEGPESFRQAAEKAATDERTYQVALAERVNQANILMVVNGLGGGQDEHTWQTSHFKHVQLRAGERHLVALTDGTVAIYSEGRDGRGCLVVDDGTGRLTDITQLADYGEYLKTHPPRYLKNTNGRTEGIQQGGH